MLSRVVVSNRCSVALDQLENHMTRVACPLSHPFDAAICDRTLTSTPRWACTVGELSRVVVSNRCSVGDLSANSRTTGLDSLALSFIHSLPPYVIELCLELPAGHVMSVNCRVLWYRIGAVWNYSSGDKAYCTGRML